MTQSKFKIKVCKTHGKTEFVLEARGYYRCKKCRSERVSEKRRQTKQKVIEYLGGKCSICGYNKCNSALEPHHENPDEKEFAISKNGYCRSWKKVTVELDKCILLCANCHRETHTGEYPSGKGPNC